MNNFVGYYLRELKKNNFLYPEIELKALLKFSSKINKDIFLNNISIEEINLNKFKLAFAKRLNKEPISKITNKKEFWSCDFFVNEKVLDPRPETEFIIESVQKYFSDYNKFLKIADLGTGSGCLAIILAKLYKNSKITATDISIDAINIAKKNSKKHKVNNRINFFQCKWINHINNFDLIVSNPPYLTNSSYEKSDVGIKFFEPKIAFNGGDDGLNAYREIAKKVFNLMHLNSYFILEIGYNQKKSVKKIFAKLGIQIVEIIKDYQSIERVLVLKK